MIKGKEKNFFVIYFVLYMLTLMQNKSSSIPRLINFLSYKKDCLVYNLTCINFLDTKSIVSH